MTPLPTIPFATITLALGALGGVTGAHYAGADRDVPQPAAIVAPAPSAQAAIVGRDGDSADAPRARQSVRRSRDGMFYVWATVNAHRIRFLVDTGASVVVLNATDARAIGAQAGAYSGRMQTASGGTAMAWTRLDSVEIGAHRIGGLRAAVVRDGLGVSLLGANMLAKLGPIRIEGDELELG